MRCPSCGSVYEVREMHLVSSKDGHFLLSMNCSKCSLPVWVNVFAGSKRASEIRSELTVNDLHLLDRDPISTEEVLAFSTYIRDFDGNFQAIFKKQS